MFSFLALVCAMFFTQVNLNAQSDADFGNSYTFSSTSGQVMSTTGATGPAILSNNFKDVTAIMDIVIVKVNNLIDVTPRNASEEAALSVELSLYEGIGKTLKSTSNVEAALMNGWARAHSVNQTFDPSIQVNVETYFQQAYQTVIQ